MNSDPIGKIHHGNEMDLKEIIDSLEKKAKALKHDPGYAYELLKGQFAIAVRIAMKENHISVEELAKKLKMHPWFIRNIRNEKGNFTLKDIAKISCALDLHIEFKITDNKIELLKQNLNYNDYLSDKMVLCECGSKGFISQVTSSQGCKNLNENMYYCVCYDRNCNIETPCGKTREEAVRNWNTEMEKRR
jgi:ribosome-binding protein aMBF1 (putative translation factor)